MLTGLSQTKDIMHIWDVVKYWLICHTNKSRTSINAVYCSPDNPEYASLIKKYGKDHVYTTLSDKDTIYNTSTDHPVYEEAIKIIQQYFHNAEIKSEFLS